MGPGLSMDFNPSPGLHLAMQSDLSHKGRGEVELAKLVWIEAVARYRSIDGEPPLPLAGEGWGGGTSAGSGAS